MGVRVSGLWFCNVLERDMKWARIEHIGLRLSADPPRPLYAYIDISRNSDYLRPTLGTLSAEVTPSSDVLQAHCV